MSNVTKHHGMPVHSYRDLVAWQRAVQLVVRCYQLSGDFPKSEAYGLTSQIRRAAVSIPANIAEGHGRKHTREYVRRLSIAFGSLMELETHLMIAEQLNLISADAASAALAEADAIGKMLASLKRALVKRY